MEGEVSAMVDLGERWTCQASSRERLGMVQGERRWREGLPTGGWTHEATSAVGTPSLVE